VDAAGSPTLLNCLMYKLSYYRFGELQASLSGINLPDTVCVAILLLLTFIILCFTAVRLNSLCTSCIFIV